MSKKLHLSLHPRLAAILEAVVALIFYVFLLGVANKWILLVLLMGRVLWWGFLAQITFYPLFLSRLNHWVTLIFFNFASTALLLFAHAPYARYLMVLVASILSVASFLLIPPRTEVVAALAKPQRRIRWLMTLVTIAGAWCLVFGLSIFQTVTGVSRALIIILGLAVTGLFSLWWWREYETTNFRRLLVALGALLLVLTEVAYVLILLPLGYFVNTLIITWVWHQGWILIRFHLSKEGIFWQGQRWTLVIQGIIFILLLVFIFRWH